MSLISVSAPPQFVLDGRLLEWGDLRATPESKGVQRPEKYKSYDILGAEFVRAQVEDAENPSDADVRVGVSVTSNGLMLAVDFGASGRTEVTVAVAQRGTNVAETPEALEGAPPDDEYVRTWRLSKKGVERLMNGPLKVLDGAQLIASTDGKTLEAVLPNSALPMLTDAPLEYMLMAVSFDTKPHYNYYRAPFRWVKLREPVRYEPFADIREKVIDRVLSEGPAGGSTILYSADNPTVAQSDDFSGDPARPTERGDLMPLNKWYEKKSSLGEVEVGLGYAGAPYVVAMKGGHMTDLALLTREEDGYVRPKNFKASDGVVRAIIQRNDEVHVLSNATSQYHALFTGAFMAAHWTVSRVDHNGKITTWYCEEANHGDSSRPGVGLEKPYFDATYTSFGWRTPLPATEFADHRARTRDLACRWDEKSKTYSSRLTYTPALPR